MLKTPLGRLRLVGYLEAVSSVLLFGGTMPLKYFAGYNQPNQAVGMAHGLLWLLYLAAVAGAWRARRWPLSRAAVAVLASIPPAGPLFLEPSLRREQRAAQPEPKA